MPTAPTILKLSRTTDEYILWSPSTCGPVTRIGTRAEVLEYLARHHPDQCTERVDRATETGTSDPDGAGRFDAEGLALYGPLGCHAPRWVPRERLADLCRAYSSGSLEAMLAATETRAPALAALAS